MKRFLIFALLLAGLAACGKHSHPSDGPTPGPSPKDSTDLQWTAGAVMEPIRWPRPTEPVPSEWRVVGHRGAGAESGYPENSLASTEYCRRLGLWGMECDILLTSDDKVLVAHGTADGEVNELVVHEHTLAEIRAAGTLKNGEQVPVLEDLLNAVMVDGSTLRLLVDVKVPTNGEDLAIAAFQRSCEIIDSLNARNFVIFSCPAASSRLLEEMIIWCKAYRISFGTTMNLTPATYKSRQIPLAIKCTATSMAEGSGTGSYTIKQFTDAGVPIGVFHVDKARYNDQSIYDEETVRIYLAAYPSLEFIETNYPAWLIGRLKAMQQS